MMGEETNREAIPSPHSSSPHSSSRLACLSFDVEPFDIPLEYGHQISVDRQYEIGRRGLRRVMALLEEVEARATFFITAEFALRFPDMVRQIAASQLGHEIASHGYTHGDLEPGHLELSRKTLEDISGRPVVGFRRARMAETDPAAIAAAGYLYNASENPIWLPGRYNHFFSPRKPRLVQTSAGKLVQIPASATPVLRIPLFWLAFKNLPIRLIWPATSRVLKADRSMNTYFHPWEFMKLNGFGLPRIVRRIDGARMIRRVGYYALWLSLFAEFGTYAELAERVRREAAEST
jgi:peptidoglycan/xylan/chitin deacetylase (PgdA/CDA1 family)